VPSKQNKKSGTKRDKSLIAYTLPDAGVAVPICPAPRVRDWQHGTWNSFGVRCLPLNIANGNGWELMLPGGFDAVYHGDASIAGIEIARTATAPVSHTVISAMVS
jgi:hypothetical protein